MTLPASVSNGIREDIAHGLGKYWLHDPRLRPEPRLNAKAEAQQAPFAKGMREADTKGCCDGPPNDITRHVGNGAQADGQTCVSTKAVSPLDVFDGAALERIAAGENWEDPGGNRPVSLLMQLRVASPPDSVCYTVEEPDRSKRGDTE